MDDLASGGAHHLVKRAAQLDPRVIGRVSSSRAHRRCAARPFSPRDPPTGLLQRGRRRAFPLQLHRLSLVCSGMAVLPMLGGGEGGMGREPQGEQLAVSGVWRGGAREGEGERARGRGRAGEGSAHEAGETVRAQPNHHVARAAESASWAAGPPFAQQHLTPALGRQNVGWRSLPPTGATRFAGPPNASPAQRGPRREKKG